MSVGVTIRWFAAAGEAAGRPQEDMAVDSETTTGDLLARAVDAGDEQLSRVLATCTVLVDGVVDPARNRVLRPGATVDVLPPFAGG